MRLENLLSDTDVSPYDYINKVYLARDYHLLFAKPQYWNQRIINQSAIFLVYPNKLCDVLGKDAYYYNASELDDKFEMHTEKESAQIREIAKQEPLAQIYPQYVLPPLYDEEKDTTKSRDFTVTYKTMQDVFSSHRGDNIYALDAKDSALYTEHGKVLFDRRFMFLGEIQEIDFDTLRTHFCSIIIKKKHKRSILKELEAIEIDRAFIFPELEYTAEKIRMKYM